MTVPGCGGPHQFVDGIPSALVAFRRDGRFWRFGNHLPPEEARHVSLIEAGNVAIRDIEVRKTVVVEVPGIGGPRPTAHFSPGPLVLELAVSQVPIQRIAEHMPSIQSTSLLRLFAVKVRLPPNTHPASHPHAGRVNSWMPVIIVIEPAGVQAGTDIVDTRFRGNCRERSVSIISVEIVAAKVIHDVQVWRIS